MATKKTFECKPEYKRKLETRFIQVEDAENDLRELKLKRRR
jgi:hypothetical protein